MIKNAKKKNLYCLFTLRHQLQGGKFYGTEKERIQINRFAIDAGVNCIDLEWGTEAEFAMFKENSPLLISYHDFHSMPTDEELEKLTLEIEEHCPLAIKVVPTASKIAHSVQILKWVKRANDLIPGGRSMMICLSIRKGGDRGRTTAMRQAIAAFNASISWASLLRPANACH